MVRNYFAHRPDNADTDFRAMLARVTREYPENKALQVRQADGTYRAWTYRELAHDVERVGAWFLAQGLSSGDRVGLIAENRPEWCITYLAASCAGLVVVPFDVLASADHVRSLVEFAEPRCFVSSELQKPKWEHLVGAIKGLDLFVDFDATAPGPDRVHAFAECLAFTGEVELPPLEGTSTASIIFTSGTTGTPKGVMLGHRGILDNINASIMSLPIYETDNFVAVLPFHHTYPTTCSFLSPISVGGVVTIVDRIVGSVIIANVRETGGTHIIAVPLLLDKVRHGLEKNLSGVKGLKGAFLKTLMAISRFTERFGWHTGKVLLRSVRSAAGLSSIRLLVSGGGPLNPATGEFFSMLGFDVVQGYGMSENGPLISTNTPKHNDFSSVGLPVKYTQIRIDDPNAEGIGEIVVKSPSLMQGYFRNPEATSEMFTADGFLKTGDLGRFDTRGFLAITGRSKNLIVSPGGKNIYPEEIESCFHGNPLIADVLIRGRAVDRDNRGEEVEALCYPDYEVLAERYPDRANDPQFVRELVQAEVDAINHRLEAYKRIAHLEVRTEEFEKTSSQKIKRFLYT